MPADADVALCYGRTLYVAYRGIEYVLQTFKRNGDAGEFEDFVGYPDFIRPAKL